GPARLGTALAEAGDRAIHEPRIERAKGIIAEPETLHRAGPEVLQHDVRLADQLSQDVLAFRSFHVEGEALLAPVHGHEVGRLATDERRPPARVVALGRLLDLDDLGPHVTEEHGAEWAGEDPREVDDTHAGEGRP